MLRILFLLLLILLTGVVYSADTQERKGKLSALFQAPDYFQYQYGFASDSDFGVAVLFYYDSAQENTYANAISAGWTLSDNLFGWNAELGLYTGLQIFDEKGLQPDSYGVSIYPKITKNFRVPVINLPLRAGLGLGLSYVSRIPVAEERDFAPEESEKLVVYIDYSLQTSIAQLMGRSGAGLTTSLDDVYVGYSIIHRSTAYGVFAETGGGINYLGISVEFEFH